MRKVTWFFILLVLALPVMACGQCGASITGDVIQTQNGGNENVTWIIGCVFLVIVVLSFIVVGGRFGGGDGLNLG